MSVSSALDTAATGLQAARIAIETTSNNVANAATEGYSRRSVDLSNGDAVTVGGVQVGTGVVAERIERAADRFVTGQIVEETGLSSSHEAQHEVLVRAETWLADSEVDGLTSRLQSVYDALTAASADPGDETFRSTVAYAADSFASTLRRAGSALDTLVSDVEQQLDSVVEESNSLLQQVARLNERIVATGDVAGAGDLLDQRDAALTELAAALGTTARISADGTATVLLGGHAVVSGIEARTVQLGEDDDGLVRLELEAGNGAIDVTSSTGGKIGGSLEGVEQVRGYLSDLDELAQDLADAFNDVHNAGYDRNGDSGADFFTVGTGEAHAALGFTFNEDLLDDPDLLAFAEDSTATIGDGGNLAELVDLEGEELFDSDSATAGETLLGLLSTVGADVNAAGDAAEHAALVLSDLQGLRDSISGVDLDEEAADLIRFQAAYQAAAKVLRATDDMLSTLLDIV
ncbi:MAG: flagellar hook-associated protein FlgK [Proteobacteria bacterium]|nr:flagellar hook-associated protein FlgK [Pseudomonadota bacterium]MCP4921720.1 flagellar hook-associated protein FlgK [Pseudomonadota bacterium]